MSDDPDRSDGDGGSEEADQVDGDGGSEEADRVDDGEVADDERRGRRREEPSGDDPVGASAGVDDDGAADAADAVDGDAGVGSTGAGSSDAGPPIGETASDGDRLADDLTSEFEAPDGDLEDLFTEIDADDVDAEDVWAELDASGSTRDGGGSDGDDRVEDPLDDAVLGEGADDDAIVSKASYCQRCEYFSGPPDVGCTHPGTRIVELVDVKRFRVRDCPVVAQRQGATVSSLDRDDGYGSFGGDGGPEVDDDGREYDGPRSAREPGSHDENDASHDSDDENATDPR